MLIVALSVVLLDHLRQSDDPIGEMRNGGVVANSKVSELAEPAYASSHFVEIAPGEARIIFVDCKEESYEVLMRKGNGDLESFSC